MTKHTISDLRYIHDNVKNFGLVRKVCLTCRANQEASFLQAQLATVLTSLDDLETQRMDLEARRQDLKVALESLESAKRRRVADEQQS